MLPTRRGARASRICVERIQPCCRGLWALLSNRSCPLITKALLDGTVDTNDPGYLTVAGHAGVVVSLAEEAFD